MLLAVLFSSRLRKLQRGAVLYLGFAQISSLVSHLWTLFVCGVQALLHAVHPGHELTDILLVAGPLGQGTLQLTVDLKENDTY